MQTSIDAMHFYKHIIDLKRVYGMRQLPSALISRQYMPPYLMPVALDPSNEPISFTKDQRAYRCYPVARLKRCSLHHLSSKQVSDALGNLSFAAFYSQVWPLEHSCGPKCP
jgi:hypothetical protein